MECHFIKNAEPSESRKSTDARLPPKALRGAALDRVVPRFGSDKDTVNNRQAPLKKEGLVGYSCGAMKE